MLSMLGHSPLSGHVYVQFNTAKPAIAMADTTETWIVRLGTVYGFVIGYSMAIVKVGGRGSKVPILH